MLKQRPLVWHLNDSGAYLWTLAVFWASQYLWVRADLGFLFPPLEAGDFHCLLGSQL